MPALSTRVTHYVRRTPESDQCYEGTTREPFNEAHLHELRQFGHRVDRLPLPRWAALELVNRWNCNAETYRYWIESV